VYSRHRVVCSLGRELVGVGEAFVRVLQTMVGHEGKGYTPLLKCMKF
jgi:hypothetical protein